jgi:ribosomal protein L14E/L6E/L27E
LNLDVGQIVLSKAGRDKGKKFIVYSVIDENYVYLVDGKLRKVEKPKKKKIKHIKVIDKINSNIAKKLRDNGKVLNSEIRKYIESNVNVNN